MRLIITLMATAVLSIPALAETKLPSEANNRMKECAESWQQLKEQGKTNGQDYKAYSATCLKKTAEPVKEEAATPQNKMKVCAEEWNKLKAANKTKGQTYQQFSSECLKK